MPSSGSLVFRIIGYISDTIPVNGKSIINVSLKENGVLLKETVITALGQKSQEEKLGYAIEKVEAKEISDVKSVNFVDNLAGKVAGLTISQGPTGVGSTTKITLRGESSFTNNNPLFVVDGVPINNNSIKNFQRIQLQVFKRLILETEQWKLIRMILNLFLC